jgi:hypothetical protein
VHGPGRLKIRVGDEMRVMCFKTGELPDCIASENRRGASFPVMPTVQKSLVKLYEFCSYHFSG